jgi:hypothetical protein
MPVALAAFFATRFSFAPVLRTTPFADLLVFFDEVPDFLRLAFFMDFLPFAISFSLAHSTFSGKNRCVAFLRGQLIETGPRERGSPSVSLASAPRRPQKALRRAKRARALGRSSVLKVLSAISAPASQKRFSLAGITSSVSFPPPAKYESPSK